MKSKEILLNWLDEEKTEILLKEFIDAKWIKDTPKQPKVEIHNNWWAPEDKKSDFDKAVSSWASSSELLEAMIKK